MGKRFDHGEVRGETWMPAALDLSKLKRAANGLEKPAGGPQSSNTSLHLSMNQLIFIVLGSTLVCLALISAMVAVIIKRRRKASSPLTPDAPKQQQLSCPPIAIRLSSIATQPLVSPAGAASPPIPITLPLSIPLSTEFQQPFLPPPGASLAKSKAKGLLERRGSNASLTIDLNPVDTVHCATPPKECSTEEFLTSAGNRLSRKQLKQSMKESRALQAEFVEIPLNHPLKLELPGASNKNRYKSIWPNEMTRVILPVSPSSSGSQEKSFVPTSSDKFRINPPMATSYINANYIRGYDGDPKNFIATQGPLPNTLTDFWLMAWHEKVPCIVMMTRLKEKNKIKCEPYLPAKSAQYGKITITVRSTTQKSGYSTRDLILTKTGCDENRYIKHFWFTAWPDHKAPMGTAKQLLELAQEVESERRRRLRPSQTSASTSKMPNGKNLSIKGPVIVHCSAGIGRTGCFIGTSIGMRQLREENMADVLGIVCQMRLDRGGMVQTPEQYEFLHYALAIYEKSLPETPQSAGLPGNSSSSHSSQHSSPNL